MTNSDPYSTKHPDPEPCICVTNLPVDELLPYLRPEPVAPHDLDLVVPLLRGLRHREQVAAYLTDVLRALDIVLGESEALAYFLREAAKK